MGHFCPPGSRSTDPIESGSSPDPDPQPWWWAENPGASWKESYQLPSEWICVVFLVVTEQSISAHARVHFFHTSIRSYNWWPWTKANENQPPHNNNGGSLCLPQFWAENSEAWFGIADSRFLLRSVKDEQVKFNLGVNFLPKECLRTVLELVTNPPAMSCATSL